MQNTSQVTGSTSSYARKYALNGMFCIDDTKDADTKDNREQMDPDPIDFDKVNKAVAFIKLTIDESDEWENHSKIKAANRKLTNDEKLAVNKQLKGKAKDSNRSYSTIYASLINYVEPVEG